MENQYDQPLLQQPQERTVFQPPAAASVTRSGYQPPTEFDTPGNETQPLLSGLPGRQPYGTEHVRLEPDLGDGEDSPGTCSSIILACCGESDRHRRKRLAEQRPPAPPVPSNLDPNNPDHAAFVGMAGGMWVTELLQKMWPQATVAGEAAVQDAFPDVVGQLGMPTWMEGIELDRFQLGSKVPEIKSIKVDKVDSENVREVRLLVDVEWDSETDIQLTVKPFPAAVHQLTPQMLRGLVQYVTSITAGVQKLSVKAKLLVTLGPMVTFLPVARSVTISLLQAPDVDFNITLTKGETQVLNVLKPWLYSTIAASFSIFVIPEHVFLPLDPDAPDSQTPEGLLMVRIIRATNVPKMDIIGHADCYVEAYVRGRIKQRTPVVQRSANPEWSESESSFQLLVNKRQYQSLTLEMWDQDTSLAKSNDDFIASTSIRLSDLAPMKEHELELQVVNNKNRQQQEVAVDDANVGGSSRVDVSHTRLYVALRYIPADSAPAMGLGNPGILELKMSKITVPDLAVLPLRLRPYVTGQKKAAHPPLSYALRPMIGKDPITGQERKDRKDITFTFTAVFDVLGTAAEVYRGIFVLELVSQPGTRQENIAARVEVPLPYILEKRIAGAPGGVAGGRYTLRSTTGYTFEMEILWNPLVQSDEGLAVSMAATAIARSAATESDAKEALQDLVKSEIAPSAAMTNTPSGALSGAGSGSTSSAGAGGSKQHQQEGTSFAGGFGSQKEGAGDLRLSDSAASPSNHSGGYAGDGREVGHTSHTSSEAGHTSQPGSDSQPGQQEATEGIAGAVQSGLAGLFATAEAVATSVTTTLGITPTTPRGSQAGDKGGSSLASFLGGGAGAPFSASASADSASQKSDQSEKGSEKSERTTPDVSVTAATGTKDEGVSSSKGAVQAEHVRSEATGLLSGAAMVKPPPSILEAATAAVAAEPAGPSVTPSGELNVI